MCVGVFVIQTRISSVVSILSIQDAIDGMKGKGHPITKPEPEKPAGQE